MKKTSLNAQINRLLGAYESGDIHKHPLLALQRIAMRAESQGDDTLAFQCYKELAQYVAPKLKSIEIKQEISEVKPIAIILDANAPALKEISLDTEEDDDFAEWEISLGTEGTTV